MLRFTAQGVRLDQALAYEAKTSRVKAQEWIEMGIVRVDGKPVTKASYRLKGEWVEVEPPPNAPPASSRKMCRSRFSTKTRTW